MIGGTEYEGFNVEWKCEVTRQYGRDLLDAAQLPGEVAVYGQAGGLRQHPTGGAGGNDCVAG